MKSSQFYQQLPIVINHNWDKTMAVMLKLMQLANHAEVEPYGKADHYLLKSLGTISKHWDSDKWYRLSGPAITKTMPWLPGMLDFMRELEPDGACVSYIVGNGGAHIDKDIRPVPSALNYIFYNTDPTANTYFLVEQNTVAAHPSNSGEAWLIDTQIEHGVANKGTRWNLSIHFGVEYKTALEWFASKDLANLVFGNG